MRTILSLAAAGALSMSIFSAAHEQHAEQDVEAAIEYRQSALQTMAWNFGPLGAMAKGDRQYDADKAAMRAERVHQLAVMPWEGFIEGSLQGGGHGEPTDALARIADNRDDFKARQEALQKAAARLVELTTSNAGFSAVREQIAATAERCKSCHDEYRAE